MRRLFAVLALSVLAFLAVQAVGQDEDVADTAGSEAAESPSGESAAAVATNPLTTGASPEMVERGRYLVEGVGMCGECHTPRDAKGELIMSQWLQGGPLPVDEPDGFAITWAQRAPRIANLPQHTDEQFVTLMTTGVNRDGKEPLAPMPPFRMSEDDALAIAAYLRSL